VRSTRVLLFIDLHWRLFHSSSFLLCDNYIVNPNNPLSCTFTRCFTLVFQHPNCFHTHTYTCTRAPYSNLESLSEELWIHQRLCILVQGYVHDFSVQVNRFRSSRSKPSKNARSKRTHNSLGKVFVRSLNGQDHVSADVRMNPCEYASFDSPDALAFEFRRHRRQGPQVCA